VRLAANLSLVLYCSPNSRLAATFLSCSPSHIPRSRPEPDWPAHLPERPGGGDGVSDGGERRRCAKRPDKVFNLRRRQLLAGARVKTATGENSHFASLCLARSPLAGVCVRRRRFSRPGREEEDTSRRQSLCESGPCCCCCCCCVAARFTVMRLV
jgi:hypothetical protein